MKVEVELLNVIKYERKEDKKPRTMITYRMLDPKSLQTKSDKFKGYACLNGYFEGHEAYEKINSNLCGTAVTLEIVSRPSEYDPMKETKDIVKINDISLV